MERARGPVSRTSSRSDLGGGAAGDKPKMNGPADVDALEASLPAVDPALSSDNSTQIGQPPSARSLAARPVHRNGGGEGPCAGGEASAEALLRCVNAARQDISASGLALPCALPAGAPALRALRTDARLDEAAAQQANYLAGSGTVATLAGAGGSSPLTRVTAAGFPPGHIGEAVSSGEGSAAAAVAQFVCAAAQREQIMVWGVALSSLKRRSEWLKQHPLLTSTPLHARRETAAPKPSPLASSPHSQACSVDAAGAGAATGRDGTLYFVFDVGCTAGVGGCKC